MEFNFQQFAILNLPDELLALVFVEAARNELPFGLHYSRYPLQKSYGRDIILGFLRLSEVCRRFRALLLSTSALWAGVAFHLPEPVRALALDRSGSSLLTVHVRNWIELEGRQMVARCDPRFALAVEHVARMRSLTAHDLSARQYPVLFSRQLASLERVHLIHTIPAQEDLENVHIDAPNLQHAVFEFDGASMPFVGKSRTHLSVNFPSLRSLHICVQTGSRSKRDSVLGWFVEILQNSPLIEDIRLDLDVLSVIEWETLFAGRSVQLTHLRSLTLEGYPDANFDSLFQHIHPPDRCSIYLGPNITYVIPANDEVATIFIDALTALLHRPSYEGLVVRVSESRYASSFHLGLVRPLDDPRQYFSVYPHSLPEAALLSVGFSLRVRDDAPRIERIVDAVVAALKSNQIKQLVIDAPALSAAPYLLEAVERMCTDATDVVVNHDWTDYTQDFPVVAAPDVLPLLRTDYIKAGHFADDQGVRRFWKSVVNWLEVCARAGPRVRRLCVLGYCYRPKKGCGDEDIDKSLCAQAAALVEELVDERVVHVHDMVRMRD